MKGNSILVAEKTQKTSSSKKKNVYITLFAKVLFIFVPFFYRGERKPIQNHSCA